MYKMYKMWFSTINVYLGILDSNKNQKQDLLEAFKNLYYQQQTLLILSILYANEWNKIIRHRNISLFFMNTIIYMHILILVKDPVANSSIINLIFKCETDVISLRNDLTKGILFQKKQVSDIWFFIAYIQDTTDKSENICLHSRIRTVYTYKGNTFKLTVMHIRITLTNRSSKGTDFLRKVMMANNIRNNQV